MSEPEVTLPEFRSLLETWLRSADRMQFVAHDRPMAQTVAGWFDAVRSVARLSGFETTEATEDGRR